MKSTVRKIAEVLDFNDLQIDHLSISYNSHFKLATESKYLQLIRADLEVLANGKPLEQQFSETGRINNVSSRKFSRRMEKKGG